MSALEIVTPGLQLALQDGGRRGFGRFGVPLSGAADSRGLRLSNALVGNDPFEGVLEFRLMGPSLMAKGGSLRLGIGADVFGKITRAANEENEKTHPWQTVLLNDGDILSLGVLETGAAGYISVAGGFDVSPVLGSISTYTRAFLGGLADGALLKASDQVQLKSDLAPVGCEHILEKPFEKDLSAFRIIAGPQDDFFSEAEFEGLCSKTFRVSKDADRMGIRLENAKVLSLPDKGNDIISDGLIPGAIQVPGSGEPIILFMDCQTVGGYPKIATVIQADLPRLAQVVPGDEIRFERVTLQDARNALLELEKQIKDKIKAIRPWFGEGAIDLEALYNENLIGGTVNALAPDHLEENP